MADPLGPVLVGDVVAAARVLRARPRRLWPWLCLRLLAEARRGAAHLARHGRPHPRYGDGSLMAAALRRRPEAAPALNEKRFRDALLCVLASLDGQEMKAAPLDLVDRAYVV